MWALRGALLALALAGLTGAAACALVAFVLPAVRRSASRLPVARQACVLFALRLAPTVLSLLAASLVAVSHVLFEPRASDERTGLALLVLALVAALPVASGLARALASLRATRRLEARWRRRAVTLGARGFLEPALRIEDPFPVVSVVGVLRPRLYVAGQVLERLERDEMEAVLAHESGHLAARDNLKSLLVRASPDWLAFLPAGRRLEREWRHAAELAADEHARTRDAGAAAALASALVALARMTPPGARLGHEATALPIWRGDGRLADRVRRLLGPGSCAPSLRDGGTAAEETAAHPDRMRSRVAAAGAVAALAALASDPRTLLALHGLAERLLRLLS